MINLMPKYYNGKPVLTCRDVDILHSRSEGVSRKRLNDLEHLKRGVDFEKLSTKEAYDEFGIAAPSGLAILMEPGYTAVAQKFSSPEDWKIQQKVITEYFRAPIPGAWDKTKCPKPGDVARLIWSVDQLLAADGVDMNQRAQQARQILKYYGIPVVRKEAESLVCM